MVDSDSLKESAIANRQLFDKSYESKTSELKLNLQISKNYLFASYFDSSKKQFISLEEHYLGNHDNWYLALQSSSELLSKFSAKSSQVSSSIVLVDENYTLVPKAYFDENKLESYLNFNKKPINDEQLSYEFELLETDQVAIVYAIPILLKQYIEETFSSFNWSHFAFPLLESILTNNSKEPLLTLHIQYNRFDIIYSKDRRLKFFNSYEYKSSEDLIYFLLYVMEQLDLDRETINVQLIGEFEEKSSIYELLFKYIRNVSFGNRPQNINYSNVLSSLAKHQYTNLFNQYLCE